MGFRLGRFHSLSFLLFLAVLLIAGCSGGQDSFSLTPQPEGSGPAPPAVPRVDEISPLNPSVGDTVTIRGAHFGAAQVLRAQSYVAFGDVPVDEPEGYLSWSDTEIQCRYPRNAPDQGVVTVYVGGESGSNPALEVTRVKTWRPARLLAGGDTETASSPVIAFDGQGNALCLYQVYQAGGGDYSGIVSARRFDAATGAWGDPVRIDRQQSGFGYENPQLVFDAAGNALCTFYEADGSAFNVCAARYDAASGWQAAEVIHAGSSYHTSTPARLAMDGGGNAVAVFHAYKPGETPDFRPFAVYYDHLSGWGSPEPLDVGLSGGDPFAVADGRGGFLCVYTQNTPAGDPKIYWTRFSGGTWSSSLPLVSAAGAYEAEGRLAVDAGGNALCLYRESTSQTGSRLRSLRYTPAGGWDEGTLATVDPGGVPEGSSRIELDSQGNAIAVFAFRPGSGQNFRILANRCDAVSGWGAAAPLDLTGSYTTRKDMADLFFDSQDRAVCAFYQSDGSYGRVWATTYADGAWSDPPVIIDADTGAGASSPRIAGDPHDNAACVFSQSKAVYVSEYY